MKTKVLSLIAIAIVAIVTLSFTYTSVKVNAVEKNVKAKPLNVVRDEPVGGFAMEDKL
jgi:uncharacterized membrane protein YcaP (DUF421 family)